MILHSVRIDCSGVSADDRRELEEGLAALADLDVVAWLRVGRDIAEPHVTGLLTVHEDVAALEAYRVHPDHQPTLARLKRLDVTTTRFDIETDDDPSRLP